MQTSFSMCPSWSICSPQSSVRSRNQKIFKCNCAPSDNCEEGQSPIIWVISALRERSPRVLLVHGGKVKGKVHISTVLVCVAPIKRIAYI